MHSSMHAQRANASSAVICTCSVVRDLHGHAVMPACKTQAGLSKDGQLFVCILSSHEARNVHLYRSAIVAKASLWQPATCPVKSLLTGCNGSASWMSAFGCAFCPRLEDLAAMRASSPDTGRLCCVALNCNNLAAASAALGTSGALRLSGMQPAVIKPQSVVHGSPRVHSLL